MPVTRLTNCLGKSDDPQHAGGSNDGQQDDVHGSQEQSQDSSAQQEHEAPQADTSTLSLDPAYRLLRNTITGNPNRKASN